MNTVAADDWVVVGRFGRTHGIKGFITVISLTDPRDNLLNYTDWHARINKQWVPLTILNTEVTHKFILVQVEGYKEREQIACLTNSDIAIQRVQLPKLSSSDYYWHQLVGMNVVNLQGITLGRVVEMMATGTHDVMILQGEKRLLIPYVPGVHVVNVNESKLVITVDWDEDF